MSIIEMGEKVVKEIDDAIDNKIISAVVYGQDIYKELTKTSDCNLLLIFEKVDLPTIEIVNNELREVTKGCLKTPLIIELDEIEGMMDSVPPTFLNILISYQTVYGKSLLKGLSSLNHEHLRAQTEQSLREDLFCARYRFLQGIDNEEEIKIVLMDMRDALKKAIKLYYLIKKPWITDEEEKWETFKTDFSLNDPWLDQVKDLEKKDYNHEEMKKIGISIIDSGLKSLLDKVDKMGP